MRVAMSQVPCLHEHLANAATTSSYAAGVVMVKNKELEELSMNSTALGAENTKKELGIRSYRKMRQWYWSIHTGE